MGYSGWGQGQLEHEIEARSWLPLMATADLVFAGGDPETTWRLAVSRLGGGGAAFAHMPPDTSWN